MATHYMNLSSGAHFIIIKDVDPYCIVYLTLRNAYDIIESSEISKCRALKNPWSVLDHFNEMCNISKRSLTRLCYIHKPSKSTKVFTEDEVLDHILKFLLVNALEPKMFKLFISQARLSLEFLQRSKTYIIFSRAAKTIQRQWRWVVTDPNHNVCKRRLLREFTEFAEI